MFVPSSTNTEMARSSAPEHPLAMTTSEDVYVVSEVQYRVATADRAAGAPAECV